MIGKSISHYRILEKLGEGGMGVVYKAEDLTLGRIVALKFLPPELTRDAAARERFVHEARAASALDHQNICTIFEIAQTDDGQTFMAMAYYEGEDLKSRVERGPLPLDEALEIAAQIAQGLAKAHERKIVHRDIKPANILVTRDGLVKIVDFGLAKLAGSKVTKTGTTLGTAQYMSPEQARGSDVDQRTDIWSLGIVLYEMLTGRHAFPGEYEQSTLYAIMNEEPEPVTALRSGIPVAIDGIIRKCLAKNPAERYQTAADFSADLLRLKRERSGETLRAGRRMMPVSGAGKTRPWRTAAVAIGAAVVLVLVLAIFNVGGVRDRFAAGRETSGAGRIESLAILPFVNIGSDPETDYLSDEIPATITGSLSRLSDLRVVPRSSAFRYRGREGDLAAVGRKLNVRAVLTGQIRVHGEDISIGAELVDIADDRQIWGNSYSIKLADILTFEQTIAKEITDALRVHLSDADRRQLSKRETDNAEAHRLYLKGRYFWNKRSEEGFRSAIGYFQQAIDEDPAYARAYTGLADSYGVLVAFGLAAPRDVFSKAKAAVSRALEIDSTLAEAHVSLAFIMEHYEWNWLGAEREYRRAIELDPTYATALHWYGLLLLTLGRDREAIETSEKAARIDPLSLPISASLGNVYLALRQYDRAEAQCMKVIEMDSSFAMARSILANVYIEQGLYTEAIHELEAVAALPTSTPEDIAYLGYGYARGGREREARQILARLSDRARQHYVPACFFALIHAGLGDNEEVSKWLEKAYEDRDFYLEGFAQLIEYGPRSVDPRIDDLLRRMGLKPRTAPTPL